MTTDHVQTTVDIVAAEDFLATHGRVLDRRRLDVLLGHTSPDGALAALEAYRNPDGGYGWGLEPDLRAAESQPTGAMHAFEVMAEAAPVTTPRALDLCDWLGGSSLPDGGLPMALPIGRTAGCAPWWTDPDTTTSSLQMTAQVAANAHRLARHDRRVADHPWLARATAWCVDAIRGLDDQPHAYALLFAVRFLDALAQVDTQAIELLGRLGAYFPPDGVVPVQGGTDDESLRPLDFAPWPGGGARRLFSDQVIVEELERLAGQQQPDGGWTVDFPASSPAAALEWRGYVTVEAIARLTRR